MTVSPKAATAVWLVPAHDPEESSSFYDHDPSGSWNKCWACARFMGECTAVAAWRPYLTWVGRHAASSTYFGTLTGGQQSSNDQGEPS
jgi:hypothetical protein